MGKESVPIGLIPPEDRSVRFLRISGNRMVGSLAMRLDPKSKPTFGEDETVYFFRAGQFVKVGCSVDVLGRKAILQSGNPLKLEIVGIIPRAGKSTEKRIHKYLTKDRVQGEWFKWSKRVEAYIKEYCQSENVKRLFPRSPKLDGRVVKAGRVYMGITQAELAQMIGCDQTTVSNIEKRNSRVEYWYLKKAYEVLDLRSPNGPIVKKLLSTLAE